MAVTTLNRLTREQVEQYLRDGFLIVEDLLTPDEIATVAERADLIASGQAEHVKLGTVQLEKAFREGDQAVDDQVLATRKLAHIVPEDEVLRAHALNDKIVDVVADLLETDDITLYGDQLFMKPPFHGSAKDWHQDSASFRDIFPMDLVSAWAAIDDATIENGCLWMVPGSQRWAVIPKSLRPKIEAQFGEVYPTVPVELKSGSVSFHHSLTYHASGPNETAHRRRGYATHYMRSTTFKDPSVTDAPAVREYTHVRGDRIVGTVSEA